MVSEKETFDYLSRIATRFGSKLSRRSTCRACLARNFRAMAGTTAMEDLRRILEAREPLYRQADIELDTSGSSVEESFSRLKTALQANLQ